MEGGRGGGGGGGGGGEYKRWNGLECNGLLEWLKKSSPQSIGHLQPDWPVAERIIGHSEDTATNVDHTHQNQWCIFTI